MQSRNYYTRPDYEKSEGINVPSEIIQPELLAFIISCVKGNFHNLSENDQDGINVYKRYQRKIAQRYSLNPNSKLIKDLMQHPTFQKASKDKSNNAILNKVIEFALEDLFKAQNFGSNRYCIKTSDIDDTIGKIDYIIYDQKGIIGIDITLSSNQEEIESKQKRSITHLPEFGLLRGNEFKNKSQKIQPTSNSDTNKLYIPRKVVVLEPNLILNYLNNFIDLIRCIPNPKKIKKDTILEARKRGVEDYIYQIENGIIHLHGIHNEKHHSTHIKIVETFQKQIWKTLKAS